MIAKYIWLAGSLPLLVLGVIHLGYTFFTNKFSCRNAGLEEEMKSASPVITRQTTMWKAWIGFNASHSTGVIYIGALNTVAALKYYTIVSGPLYMLLHMLLLYGYCWLARRYWFSVPFKGLVFSAICFTAAFVINLLQT